MDVSQDQLIDLALNLIGFLAAGGLLMIVASMFGRRGNKQPVTDTAETPHTEAPVIPAAPAESEEDNSDLQFINLSQSSATPEKETPAPEEQGPAGGVTRRNRSEIIRLAREMIEARRSTEEIAHSLPVSEAELAMLSQNTPAFHGEDNG